MKRCVWIAVGLLSASVVFGENTAEKVVESRIVSVGLFKNGLAVITREVELSGAGSYLIQDLPRPVHGTFWIESGSVMDVRMTKREVEVPLELNSLSDFQNQLAGQEVGVFFKGATIPPVYGKLVKVKANKSLSWNRTYQQPSGYYNSYTVPRTPSSSGFLVLDTGNGREYLEQSTIARVSVIGAIQAKKKVKKPVLLLNVKDEKAKVLRMSYLSKGISWAPSYRIEMTQTNLLQIEQKAVIKNELADFKDAQVYLISGFPSIQFSHVDSPFSLTQTLAGFFKQLSMNGSRSGWSTLTQQALTMNNVVSFNGNGDSDYDLSAGLGSVGPDIYYQPAGKRSMKNGDSLLFRVAKNTAAYDQIVEWIIPDTRKANGRFIEDYERRKNPEKYRDSVWDSIRFKNPFSFPITTGAAMVVGNGKFLGQQTLFWNNSGEQTSLHITKALSVRTRATEVEVSKSRKVIYIAGDDYYQTTVKGELFINNHRNETISVVIKRHFSGDLVEATGEPKVTLREEGVLEVNKRNELVWNIKLKPGEEKSFSYTYTIMVDR